MLMQDVPEPNVEGQRRLLALDGGGIRGLISLEVLAEIERVLRDQHDDPQLVLADYFDYFAGTSTGAMIAAGLALGWPVERIIDIYVHRGPDIFDALPLHRWVLSKFSYKYPSARLSQAMREEYGADTLFGDDRFRSLLLVVVHNSTTDSPWPLSNNPRAKYNDPVLEDANVRLPLWEVVRASTAFPLGYPPEPITVGNREYIFVDGALTPFNNPAFQLFVQATAPEYRLEWPTGADRMLLVSVGTGMTPSLHPRLRARDMHALHTVKTIIPTLMGAASVQQDIACRMVGHTIHGHRIDGELGDLSAHSDPATKAFSYARYDASLTVGGLEELGLPELTSRRALAGVRRSEGLGSMVELRRVGQALARSVSPETFAPFSGARRRGPSGDAE